MADWSGLTKYLLERGSPCLELSFVEIERLIDAKLPASSQYPAFWSNSSAYARAWKRAGYESTRRGVPSGHMGFVATRKASPRSSSRATSRLSESPEASTASDAVLVGCVKSKSAHPAPAGDLYRSPLFAARRRYAEDIGKPWYILSAEHGLVAPDEVIAPYNVYLPDQPDDYRRAWGEWVVVKLARALGTLDGLVFEVHAGAAYVDAIECPLAARGARIRRPLEGLRRGDQLAWYAKAKAPATTLAPDSEFAVDPNAEPPAATHVDARTAVVEALLAYGAITTPATPGATTFTPNPDANRLVIDNPFAFLIAVIFDQGIPAERAWRAPYDLLQRLGHLDPARMAAASEEVSVAVALPPVLHRYKQRVAGWLVKAAQIVTADYGGDAARIWNDHPTARELQRRLDRFPGIGQKKAAMAVEILERDIGVPIRELSGSDIAYDVHVRRVFLRSGLADFDDLDHMVDVARRANPDRPGAIDAPAWMIGRQWCHAGSPDCNGCVIGHACPRDVPRAARVRGG